MQQAKRLRCLDIMYPPGSLASKGRGSNMQRINSCKGQPNMKTACLNTKAAMSNPKGSFKEVESPRGGSTGSFSRDDIRNTRVSEKRSIIMQGSGKPPGFTISTPAQTQGMPKVGGISRARDGAAGTGAPFNPRSNSGSSTRHGGNIQFSHSEKDQEDDNILDEILSSDDDEYYLDQIFGNNKPLQEDGCSDEEDENNAAFKENENNVVEEEELHNTQEENENNVVEEEGLHNTQEENENNALENVHLEVQAGNEDAGSSRKRKRLGDAENRRGRNKNKEIAKLKPSEKLPVTFYNNRTIGKNHEIFARHLGIIVRDTNMCPVRVHKWGDIEERYKNHMWTAVTDVFSNDHMEDYRDHVLDHMHDLWLNWRSDLLRYNVKKKKITLRAAMDTVPNGLIAEEWKWLIKEIFSKESFQIRSRRNSKNRAKYPKALLHRTGSKPYRQLLWDEMGVKDGNEPTLLDVYRETHKKGENFANAEAAEKCDQIQKTMEKDPSLSHLEVVGKVFESKSRGRVLGYGGGIKPKDVRGGTRVALEAELTSAKQENKALSKRIRVLENENQQLLGRIERNEYKLTRFEDLISQKLNISFSSPSDDDGASDS